MERAVEAVIFSTAVAIEAAIFSISFADSCTIVVPMDERGSIIAALGTASGGIISASAFIIEEDSTAKLDATIEVSSMN